MPTSFPKSITTQQQQQHLTTKQNKRICQRLSFTLPSSSFLFLWLWFYAHHNLPTYPPTNPSTYLTYPPIHLSNLPTHPPIHLSYPSTHLPTLSSILPIHPPTHPFIYLTRTNLKAKLFVSHGEFKLLSLVGIGLNIMVWRGDLQDYHVLYTHLPNPNFWLGICIKLGGLSLSDHHMLSPLCYHENLSKFYKEFFKLFCLLIVCDSAPHFNLVNYVSFGDGAWSTYI
jgi:hypothetical protein